nr:MAG TPA: replisome organizer protein [Caudoviricetes sp.]
MDEKPSYFSVLPANVRYDSRLRPNEKLLYSEITALSNKYGYCTASNKYFANVYDVSTRAIKKWITDLERLNYITKQITRDEKTKQVLERKIYIVNNYPSEQKVPRGRAQKFQTPSEQMCPVNNTRYINNTSNNIYSRAEHDRAHKIPYDEIIKYLNSKADREFRSTTKKTQSLIKARYKEGFDLDDFKTVIDNKTATRKGKPEWDKFLRPETLFGTKFEGYLNEKPVVSDYEKSREEFLEGSTW